MTEIEAAFRAGYSAGWGDASIQSDPDEAEYLDDTAWLEYLMGDEEE